MHKFFFKQRGNMFGQCGLRLLVWLKFCCTASIYYFHHILSTTAQTLMSTQHLWQR